MKYSFFFTVWLTCFQNFSRPPWKNFSSGSNSVSNTSPGKIEKKMQNVHATDTYTCSVSLLVEPAKFAS